MQAGDRGGEEVRSCNTDVQEFFTFQKKAGVRFADFLFFILLQKPKRVGERDVKV